MGAIGGPYGLYAVDDEWFAGQSYSPGAYVAFQGTLYLARNYVTNSQVSPDQDTDNWTSYGSATQGPPGSQGPQGERGLTGLTGPAGPSGSSLSAILGGVTPISTNTTIAGDNTTHAVSTLLIIGSGNPTITLPPATYAPGVTLVLVPSTEESTYALHADGSDYIIQNGNGLNLAGDVPISPARTTVLWCDGQRRWHVLSSVLPPQRASCYDSFRRVNGAEWGPLSDGVHSWAAVHVGGSDNNMLGHQGHQHANASVGDGSDLMYITPLLGHDDFEMVFRWTMSDTGDGLYVFLRENAGAWSIWARLLFSVGNADADFAVNGDTDSDSIGNLPGAAGAVMHNAVGGDTLWTRIRASGLTYSWRTWTEFAVEPAAWDGTYTTAVVASGRSLGFRGGFGATGHDLYISSLTVYDLGDL